MSTKKQLYNIYLKDENDPNDTHRLFTRTLLWVTEKQETKAIKDKFIDLEIESASYYHRTVRQLSAISSITRIRDTDEYNCFLTFVV